jgi:uncharacterized protein YecA (UPF0149 family)
MTGDLDVALSDDELDLLDDRGIDLDRVLGVLHAVLVAPGMIPPSQWIPLAFADVSPDPESIQLLLRLYNQVGDLLRGGRVFVAEEDDEVACAAFAEGRQVILRDLGRIVITTYSSFAKYRVPTASPPSQARPGAVRVGRNEPCPCGSGKKYKRCCLDQT